MRYFVLLTFLPFLSHSTSLGIFPGAGMGDSPYAACMPTSGFGVPTILFDQLGNTQVNTTSEDIVSVNREDGMEKIEFWQQVTDVGEDGSFAFKRRRAQLKIAREQNRPSVASISSKVDGVDHVVHKTFEYNSEGRCRPGKSIHYKVKDGKVLEAVVESDAGLCDKIVDSAKKNKMSAATLNMCATAFSGLTNVIADHAKSYGDMSLKIPGQKDPQKVSAKMGGFSFSTGKVETLNSHSTEAMLLKVSQCQFMGGVGLPEPMYGNGKYGPNGAPAQIQPQEPAAAVAEGQPQQDVFGEALGTN